ncbi:hypothetical protein FQN57_007272 [Myotisia sp. PD_48]|nr:hypothetical protein FQN57_007272 [Myotisia sp. PD_48]
MAFKTAPSQMIAGFMRSARRRAPCTTTLPICPYTQSQARTISSTQPPQEQLTESSPLPRWKYTPPAMKAPVRLRGANKPQYTYNSDPAMVDKFYVRMLGENGPNLLSEEVKWQVITHKSFDQGRRGFNDRMAFHGKQIILLQASLALIQSTPAHSASISPDSHGTPSPLQGIEILSRPTRTMLTSRQAFATLARKYGLVDILRWVPRKRDDLTESGIDTVLTQAMYAVIGAIAFQNGGRVANEITRERILKPLGFSIGASA